MGMEVCLNCKNKVNMQTCLLCEGRDLFEAINENGAKPNKGAEESVPANET